MINKYLKQNNYMVFISFIFDTTQNVLYKKIIQKYIVLIMLNVQATVYLQALEYKAK